MTLRYYLFLICIFFCSITHGQILNWVKKQGTPGTDYTRRVATDNLNNHYAIGVFSGTLSLDSLGSPRNLTSAGSRDIFVVKYNCFNVLQWRVRIGSSQDDGGAFAFFGIEVGATGNVYISGSFQGNASFNHSNQTVFTNKFSAGNYDIFIAKLNSNGIFQWVSTSGSDSWDEASTLAIDKNENVYTTGFFSSNATFGSGNGSSSINQTSAGSSDIFVSKHTSAGQVLFVSSAGGGSQDVGNDIELDAAGNIYVVGGYSCCGSGSATFGTNTINNGGSWGGYFGKLNPTGTWLWVNNLGNSGQEALQSIAIDEFNQSIFVVGHTNGNSVFSSQSPGSNTNLTITGGFDIIAARLTMDGSIVWARTYGGTGDDYGWGIALGTNGNPVISGDCQLSFSFGGIPFTSTGSSSGYLTELNRANGNGVFAQRVGGTSGNISIMDVDVSPSGSLFGSGYFTSNVTLGSTTLSSSGSEDGLIVNFLITDTTLLITNKTSIPCNDSARLSVPNKTRDQFRWFRNDTLIAVTDSNFLYIKASGRYKVVNINNCALPDTSNSLIITSTTVTLNLGPPITACVNDSIQLNITSNGTQYSWTPAALFDNPTLKNPKLKLPASGRIYVTATSQGCSQTDSISITVVTSIGVDAGADKDICSGSTITLNATGANTYSWWPNIAINDTTLQSPIISTQTSRYYYVRGNVGTCSAIDSVWINYINVIANAGNDTLICPGDTITLNALVDPNIGNWWPNHRINNVNLLKAKVWPEKDTIYVISAINGSCVAKDTVKILIRILPNLDAGAEKRICLGDTVQLTATGANFFNWLSNYNITSVNTASTRVFPLIDTAYVVEGINDVCPVYDTVLVKVLPYPTVDAGEDITICNYETTQLQGLVNNNSSFTWLSNASLSDIKVLDPIAFPSQTTSYVLTANNQQCASSDTVTVWVSTPLNAAISANPIKGIVPLSVNFTNQSSNTGKTFWWTFGDGNSGNTRDIQHTFDVIGKYTTQMVVADSNGCMDTANIQIVAMGEEFIWIPNVFTPQGDKVNDVFKPVFIGTFEFMELRVYSRWGELLHIANVPEENWWNGTYKGNECPDGVYVFILIAKGGSGKSYEIEGNVTLLR